MAADDEAQLLAFCQRRAREMVSKGANEALLLAACIYEAVASRLEQPERDVAMAYAARALECSKALGRILTRNAAPPSGVLD